MFFSLFTRSSHTVPVFFFSVVLAVCFLFSHGYAEDNPLNKLRDEAASYFKPVTGRILAVEDKKVTVNLGEKDSIRPGMRFQILREEAPFKHPVTKEPLGMLESLVGKMEIKEVSGDSSEGEIIEGAAQEGDKARISSMKVNLLFCQSSDTDWRLSESYYRMLKETERFQLIDTGIDTDVPATVIEEAKRLQAEAALLLTSKSTDSGMVLTQRLFWTSDGTNFSETDAAVDIAFVKTIGSGDEFFKMQKEVLLTVDLPVSAKLMTVCDADGDGKQEIAFSTGRNIRFYTLGAVLQPAIGGVEIVGSTLDDHIWLDSIDLNRNGRDEIIITSMKGDEVVSSIYEFRDSEFILLYEDKAFLRKLDTMLVTQSYSRSEGFDGDVYSVVWDGEYKKEAVIPLPKGVNIYDFAYIDDPQNGRVLFAYDGDGFLNVYNNKDVRIWRSKSDTGGFLTTFKRTSPSSIVEKSEWAVKDRLFVQNSNIFVVRRFPIVGMLKGIGYKSSRINRLRWNGLSIEEGILIDNIDGTLYDYAISGDKIIVLASPMFGIKAKNILKGENPVKTELHIYTFKGL
jgi:hypothetical protein